MSRLYLRLTNISLNLGKIVEKQITHLLFLSASCWYHVTLKEQKLYVQMSFLGVNISGIDFDVCNSISMYAYSVHSIQGH